MNFIIGSGLIGMLAKEILGDQWKFIPQKRSRYYSFMPVLADDFIVRDESIDDFVNGVYPLASSSGLLYYKRAFSFAGELMYREDSMTIDPYLNKIYGNQVPSAASKLLKSGFWVYQLTAKAIHDLLQKKYYNDIVGSEAEVSKIDTKERTIITNKEKLSYDKIICTAPFDALLGWIGADSKPPSKTVCYYHILTDKIDLEGAGQALVCDAPIDFFKVSKIKNGEHLIWTFDQVEKPLEYFGAFFGYGFEIVDVFRIENAIPIGEPPDMKYFESMGIYCVGSNAQHDDFMDVSSSIKRLLKIREKD